MNVWSVVMAEKPKETSVWRALLSFLQSVLAALIGVQSQRKREQDFRDDGLGRILLVAFVAAVLLLFVVSIMVNMALPE